MVRFAPGYVQDAHGLVWRKESLFLTFNLERKAMSLEAADRLPHPSLSIHCDHVHRSAEIEALWLNAEHGKTKCGGGWR